MVLSMEGATVPAKQTDPIKGRMYVRPRQLKDFRLPGKIAKK